MTARDLLPPELRGDFDELCLQVQRAMLNMERFQVEQRAASAGHADDASHRSGAERPEEVVDGAEAEGGREPRRSLGRTNDSRLSQENNRPANNKEVHSTRRQPPRAAKSAIPEVESETAPVDPTSTITAADIRITRSIA